MKNKKVFTFAKQLMLSKILFIYLSRFYEDIKLKGQHRNYIDKYFYGCNLNCDLSVKLYY